MHAIGRTELKRKLDEGRDLALVEVLKPEVFAKFHLPGAINAPLEGNDFDRRIRAAVPDKAGPSRVE